MLEQRLQERSEAGNLRQLSVERLGIDFLSNDYLGMARNADLKKAISKCEAKATMVEKLNGSTGSRLLSGNDRYAEDVEEQLSTFFLAPRSLIFNSGYTANLSLLSCVPQKDDTIICDQLIHASLIDGARLSYARRLSFRHNDLEDLEKKLRISEGQKYVVVETIYSMDGDDCPLTAVVELAERYNARVIVDEAHSTGLWGYRGNGLACKENLQDRIFARIYTFGKAMGIHGACICGSQQLIDYLINFARPFIYSTSMPMSHFAAIESAFKFIGTQENERNRLFSNIDFFKKSFALLPDGCSTLLQASDSAIQVIASEGNEYAKHLATQLRAQDLDVRAILSPTVAKGKERLRICLHSFNTENEIATLINALAQLL